MKKNVSGQKWRVFAYDRTDGTPKTGDAAQITTKIAIDNGTATALTDTNPTETEDGYYLFDLTQAETNGDELDLYPESSTSDIQVIGVPGHFSTVPQYFSALGIEADGDLTKVNTLDGQTPQTGDNYARIGAAGAGLTEAGGTGDQFTGLPLNDLSQADIRTAIGLAAANLDTQIAALPTDADVNAQCDTAISDAALATAANLQIVDDNVDAILVDTNELQTNQGNWLTATGFSTHSAADVWAVTTRTLSSFGTLVSDIATAVWAAVTRTLTAGTKDTEIEAIKAVTDVIPDSGQMTSIAQDATVAKSTELFDPDADKVNIGKVNDITIDGSGTEEDPWGPA